MCVQFAHGVRVMSDILLKFFRRRRPRRLHRQKKLFSSLAQLLIFILCIRTKCVCCWFVRSPTHTSHMCGMWSRCMWNMHKNDYCGRPAHNFHGYNLFAEYMHHHHHHGHNLIPRALEEQPNWICIAVNVCTLNSCGARTIGTCSMCKCVLCNVHTTVA